MRMGKRKIVSGNEILRLFQIHTKIFRKISENIGEDQFETLTSQMSETESLDLLKQKGVFPYDYMTDF